MSARAPRSDTLNPVELLRVLDAARAGDLDARMRGDGGPIEAAVAERVNDVLSELQRVTEAHRALSARSAALLADEARLRAQEEELALSSKYKQEFLANLSHELRTPLNSLLILARLLTENREGNLGARQVEFARTIHGAGSDLLALIDDMLDLSRLDSGTLFVELDEVPLDAVRAYVERTFRPIGRARGLTFTVTFAPELPRTLQTDLRRLQQVLRNLLANAFKFTERGAVRLDVAPAHDDPSRVAFAVSDSGIGIPEEKQALIFEAFQQADGSTRRRFGGTGLGLAISREIARLLGGEIRVRSAPGEGSTFTLLLAADSRAPRDPRADDATLPPYAPRVPVEPRVSAPPPDPVFAGRRVLVIDHDVRNIFALTGLLERQGMSVAYAEDHRRGLARLSAEPRVDAVLMEAMIPGSDGVEALREMRAIPALGRVPVLALTTRVTGVRERLLAAGATDCVTRPVDPVVLLALLRTWFAGP